MFDRTIYKSESKVVAVTKEIEKTISPDKVTEMYDSVREQAEKDVIASLRVQSNTLNGVVVQIADEYSTATSRVHTRFILNGQEFTNVFTIDKREPLTDIQMYENLADNFRETVTGKIFRDASTNLQQAFAPNKYKSSIRAPQQKDK